MPSGDHPHNRPRYVPTDAEIAEATARIRAGWTDAERQRRAPHLLPTPAAAPVMTGSEMFRGLRAQGARRQDEAP